MMDDSTFLAAIRAEPDADAPRLIYADWLDEHGHTDRALYLRLVHQLTELPDGARERRRLVKQLLRLAKQLDESWRDAAGQRFDVLIEGWVGGAMFVLVRAVRWLTGASSLGNLVADDSSRSVALRRNVLREEAEACVNENDSARFQRNPEDKTIYRIVPSSGQHLAMLERPD